MFLIDRINLEQELKRKGDYLRRLAGRMEAKVTDLDIELKVLTMNEIGKLNRKLLTKQ